MDGHRVAEAAEVREQAPDLAGLEYDSKQDHKLPRDKIVPGSDDLGGIALDRGSALRERDLDRGPLLPVVALGRDGDL